MSAVQAESSQMRVLPNHILNCEFSRWYPVYKDVTFKSHILDCSEQFLQWLKTDGVSLPPNTPTSIFCDNNCGSDSEDEDGDNIESGGVETKPDFNFDEWNKRVISAIDDLGGFVFPKTNWSSPQVFIHAYI
jgi:hypothetical protein